ncbi:GntR family transcriptional regulator [Xanthomonas indica]|uniref:GntR family transcriptional regulator n=1 Tax=Xanthomonas indica TaxID=2912242 RepID=A0AAU8I3H1_9XANT|nr:GntR family transcriptional regulator [Xanthomonas indica]MCI2261439.1 GntR family transcriptional regulator [Xanthomonas indica]
MDATHLHVQPSAPEPIYRQIAEQIRRLVAAGQLRPGDGLPSVREVAAAHAVNPMTVSRAYSQLEAEGVLERLRGRGMAIAATATAPQRQGQRLELIEPRLQELVRHCRELGLPAHPVIERLEQLFGEPGDE